MKIPHQTGGDRLFHKVYEPLSIEAINAPGVVMEIRCQEGILNLFQDMTPEVAGVDVELSLKALVRYRQLPFFELETISTMQDNKAR